MIGEEFHRFIPQFNTIPTDVPRIRRYIQNEGIGRTGAKRSHREGKQQLIRNMAIMNIPQKAHNSVKREIMKARKPKTFKFSN